MSRLSTSTATLHVRDTGDHLLTWWDTATPDTFTALRASFAVTFPRPGEALWQREASAWAVPYRYQKRLNKWIARWFEGGAVRWEQEARRRTARERDQDEGRGRPRATALDLLAAYETLHLLPSAPPEVVTAAYRCLAQRQHPDRGGDEEAMVRLNAAVACIRAHQARSRPRA